MKTSTFFSLLAFLCLGCLHPLQAQPATSGAAAASKKDTATLIGIEGKVDILRFGAADWVPGQTNQQLRVKDRLRTGLKSRATLLLSDQTISRVRPLTSMEIEPSDAGDGKNFLNVQQGSTYFFNRENPVTTEFKTPRASGAIRGTEFNIDVDADGRTIVTLVDGEVDVKNAEGQVNLKSGQQATVDVNGAPKARPTVDALNVIQWSLYYPGSVDPDELNFGGAIPAEISASITAYRAGDLLAAVQAYPAGRTPATEAEKIYLAAIDLAVGEVEECLRLIQGIQSPQAGALREIIAAVKNQPSPRTGTPSTASEWISSSYHLQSQRNLDGALNAARQAVAKSPNFGFGWVRLAELEFGFGRTAQALEALNKGLAISPRNVQGISLKGFMLAAQGRTAEAVTRFNEAISIDSAFGNAWLGRGLCRIRMGDGEAGRQDLQTAATLEPNRSMLRSYLGKAWSHTSKQDLARKELNLARKLDANDPTPALYSALLNQQNNRLNEGISDLEASKALNENRSLFRSRMLLDQDQAVRSANLAKLYQDNGMVDVSVREASRAVNSDYANASAHLFLANSYFALLDPRQFNLRYQTPWLSELLLANLLAPVGAGSLSQNVSLHEYSRLFDGNRLGFSTATEYLSSGDWISYNSHYGSYGNTSYSLDANYRSENGQRPNNDIEKLDLWAKIKHQVTPQDLAYFQLLYAEADEGDIAQNYSQSSFSPNLRVKEKQAPIVFAGWNHEWQPGVHTLFLAGYLNDRLTQENPASPVLLFDGATRRPVSRPYSLNYLGDLDGYTMEAQQLWEQGNHQVAFGGRFQSADLDTSASSVRIPLSTVQDLKNDLQRISAYGYYQWQILPSLRLIGGISYDHLDYPINVDTAPLSGVENSKDQVSPKAGFIYEISKNTFLRGAYTRSLGGVFFDNSIRLEPTQVAGFNQAFRSLIPESAAGIVPGTRFETFNLGLDHTFSSTRTYLGADAEWLRSNGERAVGSYYIAGFLSPTTPLDAVQRLDYEERSLIFTLNQLVANEWSLGARYKISEADLRGRFLNIPARITDLRAVTTDNQALLQSLQLYGIYNHRCGFFSQFVSEWNQQNNRGYTPDTPGDDFWQHHFYVGYRFARRMAEVRLGILNLTDQDYQLNPLNLYSELPRERTFSASLKLNF